MIALQKSEEINDIPLLNDLLEKGLFVVTKEWWIYPEIQDKSETPDKNVKVIAAWANRFDAECCYVERGMNDNTDSWHGIYYPPPTKVIDLVPEDFRF